MKNGNVCLVCSLRLSKKGVAPFYLILSKQQNISKGGMVNKLYH